MAKTIVVLLTLILLTLVISNANASSEVLINEAMANPNEGEGEWIELYFPNGPVDISSYYLKDKVGSDKKELNDVQICGNYAVFIYTGSGGWLNNSGNESIFLYDQNDAIIDSKENWQNPGKGKSIGRTPDGADNWSKTESSTKCAANSGAKPAESQPANQNNQNPSPTPSLSINNNSANPKASPKPSSNINKPPSPKSTTSPTVLGEKEGSSSGPISLQVDAQLSPTPTPQTSEKQPSKIAGISITAGAVLILISFGAFLWYKWEIRKPQEKQEGTD